MWFPTLLDRMDSTNATSICDTATIHTNQTQTNPCGNIEAQKEAYFETFLQASSTIPGMIMYVIAVDRVGRKLLLGLFITSRWPLKLCVSIDRVTLWHACISLIWNGLILYLISLPIDENLDLHICRLNNKSQSVSMPFTDAHYLLSEVDDW